MEFADNWSNHGGTGIPAHSPQVFLLLCWYFVNIARICVFALTQFRPRVDEGVLQAVD